MDEQAVNNRAMYDTRREFIMRQLVSDLGAMENNTDQKDLAVRRARVNQKVSELALLAKDNGDKKLLDSIWAMNSKGLISPPPAGSSAATYWNVNFDKMKGNDFYNFTREIDPEMHALAFDREILAPARRRELRLENQEEQKAWTVSDLARALTNASKAKRADAK